MIPCNLSSERRHRIHGLLQKPDFWCLRLGQPWRVQLVVHSSASVLWMHENNNDNNKTQPIAMNKYEKIVIIVITIATIITIRIIYNYSNSIYIYYIIYIQRHIYCICTDVLTCAHRRKAFIFLKPIRCAVAGMCRDTNAAKQGVSQLPRKHKTSLQRLHRLPERMNKAFVAFTREWSAVLLSLSTSEPIWIPG